MDSKERLPDYRINCNLATLQSWLSELNEDAKKNINVEVDFYYTDSSIKKEFKKVMDEHIWNNITKQ